MMKICIIGIGYVGLVTGTCLADSGNTVWCVDIDQKKIDMLNKGIAPIYEPGLEPMIVQNISKENQFFTTNIQEAVSHAEICFICVGTPMGEDGSADLKYVLSAAESIGSYMTRHMYIVTKSTVPVGTSDTVCTNVQNKLDQRKSNLTFDVISNPEFLKEGAAISDWTHPDRIIIGTDNKNAVDLMKTLYMPFIMKTEAFIVMDQKSAEMTKYAANAMLATKISFINEIANICEHVGANIKMVRMGIGSDSRIGYDFIYSGCGYGGSCFPKDVQALVNTGRQYGYEPQLLQSVEDINNRQKHILADKVKSKYGDDLTGRQFGVWGLSFKPGTDDMRDAPSITIINDLTTAGAKIFAYDDKAKEEARTYYLKGNENVIYVENKYDAIRNVDALLLITEWKEFRSPDFAEMKKLMKYPVIFDGRNQYDPSITNKYGFELHQIGMG
jgi:UDPglucose 6-dehydrogenase